MAKHAEELLNTYQIFLELSEQQLLIVDRERYDEQLSEYKELELQKRACQTSIDQMVEQEQVYSSFTARQQEELAKCIERLQAVHSSLQQRISEWHSEDSREMKQIADQRKTLQAYGGLNSNDIISYYIDEKQ